MAKRTETEIIENVSAVEETLQESTETVETIEVESGIVLNEAETIEKAEQVVEAEVDPKEALKAEKEAKKAEEARLKAEAKAEAERAKAEAKAEADRLKAEKKAEADKAKAEAKAQKAKAREEKREAFRKKYFNKPKKRNLVMEALVDAGDAAVKSADRGVDKIVDFFGEIGYNIVFYAAALIVWIDQVIDVAVWRVSKLFVRIFRAIHHAREFVVINYKTFIKDSLIVFLMAIVLVAGYSSVIDYEYSYNGQALGIVSEERDVLEILDMVSDELTIQHGANVKISEGTNITFKRVISIDKEVDDMDTVLNKFTYMGSINVKAFAITVDGKEVAIVESQKIANEVLAKLRAQYVDPNKEYEYEGFVEDVQVVEVQTTLSNIMDGETCYKLMKSGQRVTKQYEVVKGDTPYGIAKKFGLKTTELYNLNPGLKGSVLKVGRKLNVERDEPLVTVKTIEISTFDEAIKYKTITEKSDKYYQYMTVTRVAGVNGEQRVTAKITKVNGDQSNREDIKVVILKQPIDKIVVKGTKANPKFIKPLSHYGISARFGMRKHPITGKYKMHNGVDMTSPKGTAVYATASGTVTKAKWDSSFGNYIVIDHGNGWKSTYAHNSRLLVSVGQRVSQGQKIAEVGSTGQSTGNHLHFALLYNNNYVDPLKYI